MTARQRSEVASVTQPLGRLLAPKALGHRNVDRLAAATKADVATIDSNCDWVHGTIRQNGADWDGRMRRSVALLAGLPRFSEPENHYGQ
jgi:hypothetical protein